MPRHSSRSEERESLAMFTLGWANEGLTDETMRWLIIHEGLKEERRSKARRAKANSRLASNFHDEISEFDHAAKARKRLHAKLEMLREGHQVTIRISKEYRAKMRKLGNEHQARMEELEEKYQARIRKVYEDYDEVCEEIRERETKVLDLHARVLTEATRPHYSLRSNLKAEGALKQSA